jgi:type I restriction enzyme S subunit
VPISYLRKCTIPVAPIEYQKHLVAEIEKQFSRLDEAVAGLKRARANLKRYKAAILKAAVEGRLTEQWRKEHPDVEPAERLLQRILVERRVKWEEAELAKMIAEGKEPNDNKWKGKYLV